MNTPAPHVSVRNQARYVSKLISKLQAPAAIAGVMALLSLSAAPLSASVILQADFNGSGSGTGGVSDIMTSGGTAVLFSTTGTVSAAGATATVGTASPFSTAGGGYLSISDPTPDKTHFAGAGVTITPASSANSFDATYSTGGTFNSVNGAVDLFFRVSDVSALVANSLRFFDVDGGQKGLRMTLLLAGSNTMRFELTSKNDVGTNGTTVVSATTPNGPATLMADTLYHIAATYTTDGSGKVTTSLYLATGNTAIDTTTTTQRIATMTTAGVFDPLLTTHSFNSASSISMGMVSNQTDSKILDIDQFRIYNAKPDSFSAMPVTIPESAATGLLISGAGAAMALVSRKRNSAGTQ